MLAIGSRSGDGGHSSHLPASGDVFSALPLIQYAGANDEKVRRSNHDLNNNPHSGPRARERRGGGIRFLRFTRCDDKGGHKKKILIRLSPL